MVTFLSTVVVLSAFIILGYRLNMYLYARGVVGVRTRTIRQVQAVGREADMYEYEVEHLEQDYGVRYARVGILLIAGILFMLIAVLITILFTIVH